MKKFWKIIGILFLVGILMIGIVWWFSRTSNQWCAATVGDFADALREYGFIDAIYLIGGNESGFYRASDGTPHFSEKAAEYRTDKHHGIAP